MMSETEDKFGLTSSLCLIWKTERPFEHKNSQSPVFIFRDCELYLEFRVYRSEYYLYMASKIPITFNPKFSVTTYYLDPQQQRKNLFCGRMEISSLKACLGSVSVSTMQKNIMDFSTRGIFTVVCVFDDDSDSSIQPVKSRAQQSVHFPLKTEGLLNGSESPSSVTKDQVLSFENLSKDLEGMLDNKILPDLQLMVEKTSIPCHRAVLASRSKVFAAMFRHEMTESTSGILEIKDIDPCTIEVFLKYLYNGKIPDDLTEDMLVKLFKTGDKYEVNVLKTLCSSELMKKINDENCLSYLSLAAVHNHQEFKDAVSAYIVEDDRFMSTEDWIQFSSENPILANEVYGKYFEIKNRKRRKVN